MVCSRIGVHKKNSYLANILQIITIHVMWVPVTTTQRVFGLQMEETASRCWG